MGRFFLSFIDFAWTVDYSICARMLLLPKSVEIQKVMENQTFRSRLVELIQKSRKAMRLYSSMGRTLVRPGETRAAAEFADVQTNEWRGVNAELVKRLSFLVELPQTKMLISDVLALRDQLYSDFRINEADLRTKQRDLIFSSEHGDFIKAALLSRDLVVLKAKVQATQAAHHELDAVVRKSKISIRPIELGRNEVLELEAANQSPPQVAKVIQLRKIGQ